MSKGIFSDFTEGIDEPVPAMESSLGFLHDKRIQVNIIYPDMSKKIYYKKLPKTYFMEIKDKAYFILPERILKGKIPSVFYFYNNPFPLKFVYQFSNLKPTSLMDKKQVEKLKEDDRFMLNNTQIDSQALKTAFSSNLINKMYANTAITWKGAITILIVVAVLIMVVLQMTGQVDIIGMIGGVAQTK